MDISVVIPVYNEEGNLTILHRQLSFVMSSLNRSYEIIFVDDGSVDNSPNILDTISKEDQRVKVIHFDHNYGKTSAFDAGFRNSKGGLVITIDADLQINPQDIIKVLEELENCDVVLGWRCNRKQIDGLIKFISSKAGNFIRNLILKENIRDAGCSLEGYKRQCLDNLILYSEFDVFIPSLMKMAGYRIKEIKIQCFVRKCGRSKYNIRNRLFKTLLALLIVKWMQKNRLKYKILDDNII